MRITELFSKEYPITWDRDRAMFKTANGRPGIIRFDADTPADGDYSLVDIEFSVQDEFGVTGQGDASSIFATVFTAIKEYISVKNPDFITFSAKEPSRQKLYSRMVTRMPGYQEVQTDPWAIPVQLPEEFDQDTFMLVKNKIADEIQ